MSQRPTIHQVSGGWCRVCGELEDWLRDQGEVVEAAEATGGAFLCCGRVTLPQIYRSERFRATPKPRKHGPT